MITAGWPLRVGRGKKYKKYQKSNEKNKKKIIKNIYDYLKLKCEMYVL